MSEKHYNLSLQNILVPHTLFVSEQVDMEKVTWVDIGNNMKKLPPPLFHSKVGREYGLVHAIIE